MKADTDQTDCEEMNDSRLTTGRYHSRLAGRGCSGILLLECLVYLSVVSIVFGFGLLLFHGVVKSSQRFRQASEEMIMALRTGERWREDIQAAIAPVDLSSSAQGGMLVVRTAGGESRYAFEAGELRRSRSGAARMEVILSGVKSSEWSLERRGDMQVWRWELELEARVPRSRLRPMFTFLAVPHYEAVD
jgi:Tfp pilus assembly protein FimT